MRNCEGGGRVVRGVWGGEGVVEERRGVVREVVGGERRWGVGGEGGV